FPPELLADAFWERQWHMLANAARLRAESSLYIAELREAAERSCELSLESQELFARRCDRRTKLSSSAPGKTPQRTECRPSAERPPSHWIWLTGAKRQQPTVPSPSGTLFQLRARVSHP